MNVIVHYPTSPESIAELQRRVSAVHTEAVISHLNHLSCPKSQKLKLFAALKDTEPIK